MSTQPRKKARTLKRESTIDAEEFKARLPEIMKRQLKEKSCREGEMIRHLATMHQEEFQRLMPVLLSPLSGTRSWGICGIAAIGSFIAMQAVEEVLRKEQAEGAVRLNLPLAFFVDPCPHARAFANEFLNGPLRQADAPLVCIFASFSELGAACSECQVHQKRCLTPPCDILVAAGLYSASPSSCCQGLLSYLDVHPVQVVLHANTQRIEEGSSSTPAGADLFEANMHNREYEGQRMALAPRIFGAPLSGKHIWGFYFKFGNFGARCMNFESRTVSDVCLTLRCLVQGCQVRPLGFQFFLYDGDDIEVERELVRRVSAGQPIDDLRWKNEHRKHYEKLRLSSSAPPVDHKTASSAWFGTLLPAQRSSLIYRQHYCLCAKRASEAQGGIPEVIDLCASLQAQNCFSWEYETLTMLPPLSPALWLQEESPERLLQPEEALCMSGWPTRAPLFRALLGSTPSTLKWTLTSLPLQPMVAVMQASMAAMSWNFADQAPPATDDDVHDAEALLQNLK